MKNETTITNRYSYTTCVKCSKCPLIMCTSSILLETNLYQKFYHACDSQNTDTCNSMHRNHKQIKNVMTQNLKSILIYTYSTTKNRKANHTGPPRENRKYEANIKQSPTRTAHANLTYIQTGIQADYEKLQPTLD